MRVMHYPCSDNEGGLRGEGGGGSTVTDRPLTSAHWRRFRSRSLDRTGRAKGGGGGGLGGGGRTHLLEASTPETTAHNRQGVVG